jgi:biotin-(acetyl-CoA carboxylase) ligase
VKWPNDLYVGTRKIGGLLVDAKIRTHGSSYLVIGLGLSVGHTEDDMPAEQLPYTTSWVREQIPIPDGDQLAWNVHSRLLEIMDHFFQGAEVTNTILPNQWNGAICDATRFG